MTSAWRSAALAMALIVLASGCATKTGTSACRVGVGARTARRRSAAERAHAGRPGSPGGRHRRGPSVGGHGRAKRGAHGAGLRPLPGAHAVQGHRHVRPGLHRPGRRGHRRPLERLHHLRLHDLPDPRAERRHQDRRRAARRHGLPLEVRSQGDQRRARRSSSRRRASRRTIRRPRSCGKPTVRSSATIRTAGRCSAPRRR